ncbi:MAG: hypothetical protein Q7T81_16595 [Pseudolabrys sp.]|nr:hypothetical protein [Pseudolabrys sp.]
MTNERQPDFLDAALKRTTQAQPADQIAINRVLARLSAPLPRQKVSLWRLPAVLLDWQFMPAWPRVAALGACAMLGFYVGIAGLDRPYDQLDGRYASVSSGDITSVFESDSLTGDRP